MITGKQAWAIMAAGIIAYEFSCEEDQLLSVVVDEWLLTHPILTRVVIAGVALHLLNSLPWWADPIGKRLWKAIFS
ncbi:hypothetical protein A5747_13510 [Mycobacterium sp. IS-836]|uniref:DUF7427 family protein n=1 Tax=Mycobacterium sp. IS-836 TaxID=1834160 RepID=UPI00097BA075|nr:hypothetical protein [Mycobacterium sp. IS-836]OMC55405.1 hypothetical protein A5747_13510 [Mycobacterium sp. IS-836]